MIHRRDRSPVARHERIMNHLMQELSLTAQQQSEIEPIVSRAHVAILKLRFPHQAKIQQILAKRMAELKEKLSSTQRQNWIRYIRDRSSVGRAHGIISRRRRRVCPDP